MTSGNVKIISTLILEARLEKIQCNAFNGREVFEILAEIRLIADELDERAKEEKAAAQ